METEDTLRSKNGDSKRNPTELLHNIRFTPILNKQTTISSTESDTTKFVANKVCQIKLV